VKNSAGVAQTLWDEAVEDWYRWREVRHGRAVPIARVLTALVKEDRAKEVAGSQSDLDYEVHDGANTDPIVFVEGLCDRYSEYMNAELNPEQSLELLEGAVAYHYARNHHEADMDEVTILTRKVEHRSRKLVKLSKQRESQVPKHDEIAQMKEFAQELERFTDELRQEREAQRREVDELRTLKRGLLLQLQRRSSHGNSVTDGSTAATISSDAPTWGMLLSQCSPPRYEWRSGSRLTKPDSLDMRRVSTHSSDEPIDVLDDDPGSNYSPPTRPRFGAGVFGGDD